MNHWLWSDKSIKRLEKDKIKAHKEWLKNRERFSQERKKKNLEIAMELFKIEEELYENYNAYLRCL